MFTELLETINIEIVQALSSVNLEQVGARQREIIEERGQAKSQETVAKKPLSSSRKNASSQPKSYKFQKSLKVGRNDPCPCGSGKKYKLCHG
jgi:preprotein translocase subunit SecA